ncbi:MAG TPA: hypothetical protein VGJ26_13280 [Pirellulales bacterium]|jgi:hypothetical protein
MANPNRSSLLARLHKTLKKHYKPVPLPNRPVLEQLLYACCLENARYEAADQAYAAVSTSFFDWNEVRVSTAKELADVMHGLPNSMAAANNLKNTLQSAFEATYSFDLEAMKKQNLGQAIQRLKKFNGASPFVVGYVTQAGLAGHAIPLDRGALDVLFIVGAATEEEVAKAEVAGLERAIPKTKGAEFGSLLHQLGAELVASPFSPIVHKILLEAAPEAKDRLPKRHVKKPTPPPVPEKPAAPAGKHATPATGKTAAVHGKSASPGKPVPASASAKKPAAPDKKAEESKKKPMAKPSPQSKKGHPAEKKKPAALKLAKRKPR